MLRAVATGKRHAISLADALSQEIISQAVAAQMEVAMAELTPFIDDGELIGKSLRVSGERFGHVHRTIFSKAPR
jgi:hypothetical protein